MAEQKDRDTLLGEIALEQGHLTEAQIKECREDQALFEQRGYSRSLARIATEKKLLSQEQLHQIRREMRKRGVLPRFGGYEIVARVGQGAMGVVYKARQLSLDRVVALKVLPSELVQNAKAVERFRREALIAARITHPHAVQILDVGEDRGRRFIAMEFVDGVSASDLLRSGPVREQEALRIVRCVSEALAVAHELGIIHRDIKPANIMLTRDGEPKLADLGIARQTGLGEMTLTQAGAALGTPHYMSPEQCEGLKDIDGRADIYSLGATLFHLVCGRTPFEGATTAAILHKQVYEPLPDPKSINPGLSEGVTRLIRWMMEKDRDKRPQNCADLIAGIGEVERTGNLSRGPAPLSIPGPRGAAGEPAAAALSKPDMGDEGTSPPPPSPRRVFWPAVGSAVAVLLAVYLVLMGLGVLFKRQEMPGGTHYKSVIGMEFVYIPPGEFMMGNRNGDEDEKPVRRVRITKGFYFAAHEVTLRRFRVFVEAAGYSTEAERGDGAYGWTGSKWEKRRDFNWRNPGFTQGDDHPVVCVSWNDAQAFCKWLSRKEGVACRLPTEAEWEYACRAGTTSAYWWGDDPDGGKGCCNAADQTAKMKLPGRAVFNWPDGHKFTSPAGSFKPNGFGLYDMHGNVCEWCADWYDEGYYGNGPEEDPSGPATGTTRVLRGGSWFSEPRFCRSADRGRLTPGDAGSNSGFRVLLLPRP